MTLEHLSTALVLGRVVTLAGERLALVLFGEEVGVSRDDGARLVPLRSGAVLGEPPPETDRLGLREWQSQAFEALRSRAQSTEGLEGPWTA